MIFYIGIWHLNKVSDFENVFISYSCLRKRKSNFEANNWIMDSGAFTEISTYGEYRTTVEEYVSTIERWKKNGFLEIAVSQDYMCEPFILEKTGLTVKDHQELTIQRFDKIRSLTDFPIMPVIQGYEIDDYLDHIKMYGNRLSGRVGVGSLCKRNRDVKKIETILFEIKKKIPHCQLHGFGLKKTALFSGLVRKCLYSCDSMAWDYEARRKNYGKNPNSMRYPYAYKLIDTIENGKIQHHIMEAMC